MVFFTHSVRTYRNYSTSKEVNQLGDEASIECSGLRRKREKNERLSKAGVNQINRRLVFGLAIFWTFWNTPI